MKKNKKMSYSDYWNQFGDYGKERIRRMLQRKTMRHFQRMSRVRNGYKYIDGELYQICSYQPNWDDSNYCRVPCNGDC